MGRGHSNLCGPGHGAGMSTVVRVPSLRKPGSSQWSQDHRRGAGPNTPKGLRCSRRLHRWGCTQKPRNVGRCHSRCQVGSRDSEKIVFRKGIQETSLGTLHAVDNVERTR